VRTRPERVNGVELRMPTGRRVVIPYQSSTFVVPPDLFGSVTWDDTSDPEGAGRFRLRYASGLSLYFESSGRLAVMRTATGQRVQVCGKIPGMLAMITQPSQRTETRTYRPDGALAKQVFHDPNQGGGDDVVHEFFYDAAGHRTKMQDRQGAGAPNVSSWSYDTMGRVLTQSTPNLVDATTATVTVGWSLAGNIVSLTYPDGAKLLYSHDTQNRMNTTKLCAGTNCSAPITIGDYAWTNLGQISNVTKLDGGASSNKRDWTYYTNGAPQPKNYKQVLVESVNGVTTNNINFSTNLTYNADGRLKDEQTTDNVAAVTKPKRVFT
jgi:hypothetical protein